jgi:hypothetical protein
MRLRESLSAGLKSEPNIPGQFGTAIIAIRRPKAMELIMGKVQTQQSQKGGSFNEHWESVRFNPQGYDLYVSDPRWAGRFTMVTFERTTIYNGPPRIRTGYFDRLTGNFRFTGAKRGVN